MSTPSPSRKHSTDRRRALTVLAGSAEGCTEAILLAHGFPSVLVAELIHAGLATAHRERMGRGGRPVEVTRIMITEAGRRALA
jgi:hypothetical protein